MFRRAVTFPSPPASVWHALTDPAALGDWFGAPVELDLRPGGQGHFRPTADDGGRVGTVEAVETARHLCFRWWPHDDEADVSEVSYDLEDDGEGGTTLTVTERRVPAEELAADEPAVGEPVVGELAVEGLVVEELAVHDWSTADQITFEIWACSDRPAVVSR